MAQQALDAEVMPGDAAATAERSPGISAWWVLAVVSILNFASFVDRGGITLMVNPIKADLGIDDVEMSLLMGLSFTLVSITLGIPAGWIVDIFNRRILVAGSVVVWSFMSSLTGFATSFWTLFFTRNGLACAEAAMPPAAHSMIRDAFPPEKRGIAFSIYTAGFGLSASISLLITGTLIRLGDSGYFHSWPLIGHFKTWQIVLAFPGMCTFPLALLIFTVRDPQRRTSQAIKTSVATFGDAVGYVRDHRWVYVPLFASSTFLHVMGGGATWRPTAMIRGWGLHPAEIAHVTGSIGLVASISGLLATGYLMDRLSRRGIGNGPLRVAMFGNGLSSLCYIAALHVHEAWQIYTLLGIGQFFGAAGASSGAITLAYISPSRLMGRMTALLYLCMNLLGSTPAPTLVALVAAWFYADQGPLGIIPAINVYTAVTTVMSVSITMFAATRVARFQRIYHGSAG